MLGQCSSLAELNLMTNRIGDDVIAMIRTRIQDSTKLSRQISSQNRMMMNLIWRMMNLIWMMMNLIRSHHPIRMMIFSDEGL